MSQPALIGDLANRLENPQESAWPRITLITPSFNQGQYLEETIQSVISQHYPTLEYLIFDGGSTDNSVQIIQKYAEQLAGWASEPDSGQAAAINKGLRRATGSILAWLNSDDVLLPGTLHRVARVFRDPRTNVVCGLRKLIDDQGRFVVNWIREVPTEAMLKRSCCIGQETVFWRHSVTERIGLLDESYAFAIDYEYWQRMLAAGYRFRLLPAYLGKFRLHPQSKSVRQIDLQHQDEERIFKQYVGESTAEVNQKLGTAWQVRRDFLKDFGHQRASHHAWITFFVMHLMAHYRLSSPVVTLYRLYKRRA